jgi:hypothetical protein
LGCIGRVYLGGIMDLDDIMIFCYGILGVIYLATYIVAEVRDK